MLAIPFCLLGCTTAWLSGTGDLKDIPVVVAYALAPGASPKKGVAAASDKGGILFSPMLQRSSDESINADTGGLDHSFSQWVRMTWRTGSGIDFDDVHGGWKGGEIVGDHTVKVRERIPDDVFAYVRAKQGRAIVLHFQLKDDGVLFAWDVQELNKTKFGQELVYSMHGGDF